MGRIKIRSILVLLTICILSSLSGCYGADKTTVSSANNDKDMILDQFQNKMALRGYSFEIQNAKPTFFEESAEKKYMKIGDEGINIYCFPDNVKIEQEASYLSKNADHYNKGRKSIVIDWIFTPCIYKKGSLIVQTSGDYGKLNEDLAAIFGEPFAGGTDPKREQDGGGLFGCF